MYSLENNNFYIGKFYVISMSRVLHIGYGEMGYHAFSGLSSKFDLLGIVTPPSGENRFRTPAVEMTEALANHNKTPIYNDKGLKALDSLVEELSPDAVVICSYDKIIPEITLKKSTFINVHHGDLPRYRGRANLNWAIINGRDSIGVSVHEVLPKLDAGGIYKMWDIPILDNDYITDIYSKVNRHINEELPEIVKGILEKRIKPTSQVGEPTYCCTRLPEDGAVDWAKPANEVRNLIRGISKPFPGATTSLYHKNESKDMVIWRADIPEEPRKYEGNIPGRVGRILKGTGVEVLTGTHPLIITNVSLNGKNYRADEVIKSTASTLK